MYIGLKMRKGVALLLTLSVLAAMLSLIGVAFAYLDSARQKALKKSALIQGDILYDDLSTALKKNIGKKPSLDTLKLFYSLPLSLSTENSEFDMTFYCEAESNRIPFAWLAKKSKKGYEQQYNIAQKVFDDITAKAEVKSPDILEEMIISKLINKDDKRYGIDSIVRVKKGIMTREKLYDILMNYRFEEDDESVFSIKWGNYFSFEETSQDSKKIDGEFISPELLAIILDTDIEYVRSEFKSGELKKFLSDAGIDKKEFSWLFSKDAVADMVCNCRYQYADKFYTIQFDYRRGNVKGFEFVQEE